MERIKEILDNYDAKRRAKHRGRGVMVIDLSWRTLKMVDKARHRQEKMIKRFEKLIKKSRALHGASTAAIVEMALERQHVVLPRIAFLEKRVYAEAYQRDIDFLRFRQKVELLQDHIDLRRKADHAKAMVADGKDESPKNIKNHQKRRKWRKRRNRR